MSSLSAAQADGYYYPQEWRPEHGSLNQFQGSHPLGKRAKRLASNGELVVRFEMPFNVWCTHCETHIGRGVRYNARKKRAGEYLSTVRWEFRMTCMACSGEMVIRTDPQQRGYELVSGVRKKAEEFDAQDAGTERVNDASVAAQIRADPFFRLEHETEDKRVAGKRAKGLEALMELQDTQFKDDYASNSALRARFRDKKKQRKVREQEAARLGLSIPLLEAHPDDVLESKSVVFKGIPGKRRRSRMSTTATATSSASTSRSASASASATVAIRPKSSRRVADTFQNFGDPIGSQLQRLRASKRTRRQRDQS